MIYGYVRVATKNQLEVFEVESQKNEILEKYPNTKIFEEQFTGVKLDRPI